MQKNGKQLNSHGKLNSRTSNHIEHGGINILEYILVLGVILSTNSIFWNTLGKSYNYGITVMILLSTGCISIWICLNYKYYHVALPKELLLIVIYLLALVPLLVNSWINRQISRTDMIRVLLFVPLCIPFLDWVVQNNRLSRLADKYVTLITVFSAISLLLWGVVQFGFLSPNMSILISWGGYRNVSGLWGIQFFPQGKVNFLGFQLIRNCGIFCEAPMFSFVITFALMMIIFFYERIRIERWKIAILVVALLSTTATTGVLVIIISLAMRMLLDSRMTWKLALGLVGLPILFVIVKNILTSKVNNMGGSVNIRQEDLIAGYRAWQQKPLFGNGLSNTDAYIPYISFYRLGLNGNDGFSSGLMQVFSKTGAYGGALFVIIPTLFSRILSPKAFGFGVLLCLDFAMTVVDNTYLILIVVLISYLAFANQYRITNNAILHPKIA